MYTLYKTPTCAFCPMVSKLLDRYNKEYVTVDIEDDYDTRMMLQKTTGATSVPVLVKGDDFVVGWNPQKLMQLINN